MIPRYQRILFWSLAAGSFLMAVFLLHGCKQAHRRLASPDDATPIAAPTTSSTEDITFYIANDADASITPTTESVSLPQAPTLRARAPNPPGPRPDPPGLRPDPPGPCPTLPGPCPNPQGPRVTPTCF